MIYLKHSFLVSILECTLEVFGDLLLPELLLHTVDDGHYSFYVSIKDVTFLQALERDLTLVCASSHSSPIFREDSQTRGSDIVHDGR